MIGWWKCRRQAEAAILRRELKQAKSTIAFYRGLASRYARDLEHYKRLAALRGADQDERGFQQALDVLGGVA